LDIFEFWKIRKLYFLLSFVNKISKYLYYFPPFKWDLALGLYYSKIIFNLLIQTIRFYLWEIDFI
jgi:hypothetical protein